MQVQSINNQQTSFKQKYFFKSSQREVLEGIKSSIEDWKGFGESSPFKINLKEALDPDGFFHIGIFTEKEKEAVVKAEKKLEKAKDKNRPALQQEFDALIAEEGFVKKVADMDEIHSTPGLEQL